MYFIANFQHLTDQEQTEERNRRNGAFSMMVQAESSQIALEKFRQRLISFRNTSMLFDGHCKIYISQLIEFDKFPADEAVLLNFTSVVGDPVLPHIACVVPTEQSNACNIHEWNNNHPFTEGQMDSLFLSFD
jgi:hypothetical protein